MTKPVEMSDEELASAWRQGVSENYLYATELQRRGYKFYCQTHQRKAIFVHNSTEIQISKTEEKVL